MTTYVLMLFILSSGGEVAATSGHFYNERACLEARKVILDELPRTKDNINVKAYCFAENGIGSI